MTNGSVKLLNFVDQLLSSVDSDEDYEETILKMFYSLNEFASIKHSILFFVNEDRTGLTSVVSYGYNKDNHTLLFANDPEIKKLLMERSFLVRTRSVSQNKQLFFNEAAARQIVFPLYINDEPLGILLLESEYEENQSGINHQVLYLVLKMLGKMIDLKLKLKEQTIDFMTTVNKLTYLRSTLEREFPTTHIQLDMQKQELKSSEVDSSPKFHEKLNMELTLREREIVELAIKGYSNKQISETLNISIRTVSTHMYKIYKKLNITSRNQLLNYVK
jgi:DNA-binding CsgD family transcriptional regulator